MKVWTVVIKNGAYGIDNVENYGSIKALHDRVTIYKDGEKVSYATLRRMLIAEKVFENDSVRIEKKEVKRSKIKK